MRMDNSLTMRPQARKTEITVLYQGVFRKTFLSFRASSAFLGAQRDEIAKNAFFSITKEGVCKAFGKTAMRRKTIKIRPIPVARSCSLRSALFGLESE